MTAELHTTTDEPEPDERDADLTWHDSIQNMITSTKQERRSFRYGVLSPVGGSHVALLVVLRRGLSRSAPHPGALFLRLAGAGLWSLAPARAQIVACTVTPPTSRTTLPIAPVPASPVGQDQVRLSPARVSQLAADYTHGASMRELARQYGVHRHTVATLLRKAEVALRGQGLTPDQVETCIHLYAQGWSCARLADRFHCDPKTVWNRLREADIQLREPWAWMD